MWMDGWMVGLIGGCDGWMVAWGHGGSALLVRKLISLKCVAIFVVVLQWNGMIRPL